MKPDLFFIDIPKITIPVTIGCYNHERNSKQDIDISVKINFDTIPLACDTDKLSDTVCYEELVTKLTNYIQKQSFYLLESLGHESYKYLKSLLPKAYKLQIHIKKHITTPFVQDGAVIICGDKF